MFLKKFFPITSVNKSNAVENPSRTALELIFQNQYTLNSMVPGPYGKRLLTYADYIASGQPLHCIENAIREVVFPYYANTHTEASYTGLYSTHLREEARDIIKSCTNAQEKDVVIFCGSGSTAAMDRMNRLLIHKSKISGQKVIILHGPFEHHSNVLPWREGNFEVISIAITKDGLIDLTDLKNQLIANQGKGILVGTFSAASNVTGIISPIDEITKMLHDYGALSFWDYAAGAPYMNMDMNKADGLQKDAIFISTHKFVGGPGTPGILIAKRALFDNDIPLIPSGGTVHFVTRNKQRYFEDIETREEGGTPAIIESIRAGLVFNLKREVGEKLIEEREDAAVSYAFQKLLPNPNVFILGNTDVKRLAFFAFHIRCAGRFLHHNFVIALLNDIFGIQARGGCSCAGPYGHELLNLSNELSDEYMHELALGNVGIKPGWSRLNLNYFIPDYEMKYIVAAMEWIAEKGYLLLKDYHFDDRTALWKNVNAPIPHIPKLTHVQLFANTLQKETIQSDREKEQLRYLSMADKIAEEAKSTWDSKKDQSYVFNQVENPLRWYTLVQDISL